MAGQADGKILVESEIDPQGFESDAKKLQAAVKSLSAKAENLGTAFEKALSGSPQAVEAFRAKAAQLQQTVDRLAADMERLGAKRAPTDAYKDLTKQADKAKAKLDAAHADMDAKLEELGNKRVPTQAYADLQKETEAAGRALERLLNRQERMKKLGVSKNSQSYKNLAYDLEQTSAKYDQFVAAAQRMEASGRAYTVSAEYEKMSGTLKKLETDYDQLIAKKTQMENTGTAWISGEETAEYQGMASAIDAVNARLGAMREQVDEAASASNGLFSSLQGLPSPISLARSAFSGVLRVLRSIGSAVGRVASGVVSLAKTVAKRLLTAFRSVLETAKKLFTGRKSLTGSVSSLTSSLKKLIPAMLAARGVMGILRKGVNAFLDANQAVKSQLEATWNSLGNILGPVITRIVNLVSTAISYVTTFLRLLGFGVSGGSGSGTAKIAAMSKAVAGVGGAAKIATVQTDAFGRKSAAAINAAGSAAISTADEIHAVGDAAASTAKKIQNLSGLDQINTWKSEQDAGGGGGGAGSDVGVTLPEVELPDWAKLLAEQLRSGAWKEAAETLSEKLGEMVNSVDWPSLGDRLGEKVAGALKFLATFIREYDFADLFAGLFTALRNALEKTDAEDIGALLAARFVLIFSAMQGAVESGVIPAAIEKLGSAIEGFFRTVREKFADETDPAHGGWYVVGQNLGDVIGQIINAVAGLLSGTKWNQLVGDIGEFWGGLWKALNEGANAPDWEGLFSALKVACKRLLVRMFQWLPQGGESRKTWEDLEKRLEKDGDSVPWAEIFHALWETLMGLLDMLIEHIPSRAELAVYWDELKDKLAKALDYASWDEMTAAFADTLKNTIKPAIDSFLDYLYEQLSASHPFIASFLFPGRAAVKAASDQFQSDLEKYSREDAARNLQLWVDNGSLTEEQAREIAANAGYAYSDGMLTSLPAVEDSAQTLADEYIGKLREKVPEASAAGAALGDASAGAAKGVSDSTVDISSAAETAAAAVPAAIEGQQQPAYEASVHVGEQATSGVKSGLSGFEEAVTDTMDGAAKGGANSAKRMRRDVNKHTRQLRGDVSDTFEGMSEDMADSFSGSSTKVNENAKTMATAMKTQLNGMKTTMSSVLLAMKATAASSMDSIKKACSLESVSASLTTQMKAAATAVSGQWNSIRNTVSSINAGIKSDVTSAWSGISGAVSAQLSGLKSAVSAPFASLKNSAYSWGSEFSAQLASGIRSGISRIASAAAAAAATVRSYLHFSVPDRGPLADADEYGPDFIRLLAAGMDKSKSLAARAAANVATEIAAGLQSGQFASMAGRLQAIADSTGFRIPTVATAGVMPYSVTGGTAGLQRQNTELADVIDGLARKIESMTGDRGASYTFIGKIDKRVLFREVLDEARAQRTRTGKNPFDL